MTNTRTTNHIKHYNFIVTFFLYATLIVDLYRKFIGVNVGIVRNVIYILCFGMILWDAIKTNRFVHMLMVFIVMSLLYYFSSLLYPSLNQVFLSGWLLFVSRLWPAYYVGRYTEDWNGVSEYVRKYIWIALVYALFAFTAELFEFGGGNTTYSTIAANLFFVTWIAFYDSFHSHKVVSIIVCLFCFLPVLFLGTRAGLFGATLALVFYFGRSISKSSGSKKVVSYFLLIIGALVVVLLFSSLSNYLIDLFPNSRTLDYLRKGELFEDSNRSDSYYSRMTMSLQENPLKMYGLIGNQIFIAGENASMNVILSSFSHNVYLELCMNFGVIIGGLLSIYFTIMLFKAYRKSRWRSGGSEYVYLGVLGMTFVEMMVSCSWLFHYQIWLMIGLAFSIIRSRQSKANYIY